MKKGEYALALRVLSCVYLEKSWMRGDCLTIKCPVHGNNNNPSSYGMCEKCEHLPDSITNDVESKLHKLMGSY